MQLFPTDFNPNHNLLSKDGCVNYYGKIYNSTEAEEYLNLLLNQIDWHHDEIMIFGKKIITKRKVAWYGDSAFEYTYSKTTKTALPWTKALIEIKNKIELKTGETFNSCLLNLYHSGIEGMGWHSDDEKDLEKNAAIASLSFGTKRRFIFKHKVTKEKVELNLENGSLLLMKGTTQTHWLHSLPPTRTSLGLRVNLTFRKVMEH